MGFRKAKPEQAKLKIAIYGPPGSGKTLTSLLFAEGLAKINNKRIAFVDTEHGSDFYAMDIEERKMHPKAFDFDALYTRSITDTVSNIKSLSLIEYGVIIIDSITHIWEAAQNAYQGKRTKIDTIPVHAWGAIKKPYKDLMTLLLNCDAHVIICGRQGSEFDKDEDTGEMSKVGLKMKAEGETPYEPHILIRMEAIRDKDNKHSIIAITEKDRTSKLTGKVFVNPTFETVVTNFLPLLGDKQAHINDIDTNSSIDAEVIAECDIKKDKESLDILNNFAAKIMLCNSIDSLKALGKEITQQLKAKMNTKDVAALREKYLEAESKLS